MRVAAAAALRGQRQRAATPLATPARFGHTIGMCRCYIVRQASIAGGLGGGAPAQRGARGAAPARRRVSAVTVSASGEREGRRPLAVLSTRRASVAGSARGLRPSK